MFHCYFNVFYVIIFIIRKSLVTVSNVNKLTQICERVFRCGSRYSNFSLSKICAYL